MSVFNSKAIEVMNQVGFYPDHLTLDGRIHSFRVSPSEKKKKGWYVGYEKQDCLVLVFNDWRRNSSPFKFVLFLDEEIDLSAQNLNRFKKEFEQIQKQIKAQEKIKHKTAALEAEKIWATSAMIANHPYLKKKGLNDSYGARCREGYLIVPIRDSHEKLWGTQRISVRGDKFFDSGMKKKGCFHLIGEIEDDRPIAICEGFATGASFHVLTGLPVCVAFDAGNLMSVAKAIRSKHLKQPLIFAADNDASGVGLAQAMKAAGSVPGISNILIPYLPLNSGGKDFNDMHQILGEAEAREQILEILCGMLRCGREKLLCRQPI